jgi:hypothetical protein
MGGLFAGQSASQLAEKVFTGALSNVEIRTRLLAVDRNPYGCPSL